MRKCSIKIKLVEIRSKAVKYGNYTCFLVYIFVRCTLLAALYITSHAEDNNQIITIIIILTVVLLHV